MPSRCAAPRVPAPRRLHLELFAATRGHHLYLFFDASVQLEVPRNAPAGRAPPLSASPHQVGRRLAQGRFRNPAPRPVASAVPVPASRLGQLDPARSRPRVDGRFCPWPPRGRGARIRLVPIWCGSIRPDDSDPPPVRPSFPSRSLALHAGDRRRGSARRRRPRRRRRRIVPLARRLRPSPAATLQVSLGSPSLCISRGNGCATRVQWRHRHPMLLGREPRLLLLSSGECRDDWSWRSSSAYAVPRAKNCTWV